MTEIAPAHRDVERLLRALAPRALGAMTRRFHDFGSAEDAVQEALVAAATQWPRDGLPDEPLAWLLRVASRRLTDHVRADSARRRREALVVRLVPPEEQLALSADESDGHGADDTLRLLFMCCHPALTTPSAVALTLRAVGGLTTAEIARAFLVPEATMAQRVSRAKATIKSSGVAFEMPDAEAQRARLGAVLHVLYLVFNEGYAASSGDRVHRTDLSGEAIRLTRMLHEALPEDGEVTGLLALMLLTDARRASRTGPAGELIPLDEQDRTRWDRAMIEEGAALVTRCFGGGHVGAYALQAAIAATHDAAETAEATDWRKIAALYDALSRFADNPMVALSHAVAIAMVEGPSAGLARLETIARDPRLTEHHRLDAVRAHLLERAGETIAAAAAYRRAAGATASLRERAYLLARAGRIEGVRDT